MIETLKAMLSRAAQARGEGKSAEAEQLYKAAAEEARAKDVATRAEALMGTAQTRRDQGDLVGASIYYAEATTLARTVDNASLLAYALRHAADVRSLLLEYAVAGQLIEEAIRLYRALEPPVPLDLANALRVSALNDEREAHASWKEACELFSTLQIQDAIQECHEHLECLKHHATGPSNAETA
jgi:tetratricopeptide (TPR) repeat protein